MSRPKKSLHHRSWIIQVRQLKEKRRNELENLLSIFDPDNITEDRHILNIDERKFPEEYRHIIRKLRDAYESKQVREEMQMEDDYINELRINAEIIAEKDKLLAEKDKENENLRNELEKLKRQLENQSKMQVFHGSYTEIESVD